MINTVYRKVISFIKKYRWTKWERFWNFRHGFKPSTITLCGITTENHKTYISDWEFYKGHPWNGPYSGIIDNKVYLPYLFKDFGEYLPKFYYFKDEDGFLPLGASVKKSRVDVASFLEDLMIHKCFVLKHTYSEVGRGFYLIEYDGEYDRYFVNKELVSKTDLINLLISLKDYIIQEYIHQHYELSNINPSSLNTLRLLLVWNSKKKSFVIGRCFQRFGCNGNVVDNLGSGNGLLVYVDVESGKYSGHGLININSDGDRFVNNIVHPNSGFEFAGKEVVGFKEMKLKIVELFNRISFLKFVALDVAITNDGFKIIETNSYPDPAVAQYDYGFKSDPNFSDFFREK